MSDVSCGLGVKPALKASNFGEPTSELIGATWSISSHSEKKLSSESSVCGSANTRATWVVKTTSSSRLPSTARDHSASSGGADQK